MSGMLFFFQKIEKEKEKRRIFSLIFPRLAALFRCGYILQIPRRV